MVRHNILVILIDTLRADHLSCYGYSRETTPFIDRIADQGARYDAAYSSSIWTAPAYGTFFTGELPYEHGVFSWNDRIQRNRLVEQLNEAGYNAYGVSPHYLLGDNGAAEQFDLVEKIRVGERDLLFLDDPVLEQARETSRGEGWESRHQMLLDLARLFVTERSLQTVPNAFYYVYQKLRTRLGMWGDSGAEAVLEEADRILTEADSPYFLFLNFIEPHGPYRPPKSFTEQFTGDILSEVIRNAAGIDLASAIASETNISSGQRQLLIDLYDAEINYLDAQLRRYLQPHLDDGLLDDTVVVILSDHGEAFGEWGLWGHERRIHNNVARIPLLVSHPEGESERFEEVIGLRELTGYLIDVGEADIGDGPPIPTPSGEAFVEYYGWDTQKLRPPWETYETVQRADCVEYQVSYLEDGHKFWWDSAGEMFLSDRVEDPDEQEDCSGEAPDLVSSFKQRIREEIGEPKTIRSEFRSTADEHELDPDVATHLDYLGYR